MVVIRKLDRRDHQQLLALALEFFKKNLRAHVSKKLLPLIEYKNYDKQIRADVQRYMNLKPGEAIIFVAEDQKELIGYIFGRIIKRPQRIKSRIGYIEDWFVKEDYRSKGTGKLLWDTLIDWFRKKRCDALETDSYLSNKRAIDFYHKFGFVDKAIVMIKNID